MPEADPNSFWQSLRRIPTPVAIAAASIVAGGTGFMYAQFYDTRETVGDLGTSIEERDHTRHEALTKSLDGIDGSLRYFLGVCISEKHVELYDLWQRSLEETE